MNIVDVIRKKRDGFELSEEELSFFVKSSVDGILADYQISAMLMAMFINRLSENETSLLTKYMAVSGDTENLTECGITVDKHSTGGVGDKTTLIVAPIVASLGISVAKMSGRGLGYSGGTIDKLSSIPNFKTTLSEQQFRGFVQRDKIALIAQTKNIAPADKIFYALRDVTATVDNISLIASSIMSKKLACNTDAIVLDVKTGSGAFMKTYEEAEKLALLCVKIGLQNNKKTIALISDMNQPLGRAVGNSLEVIEAASLLRGEECDENLMSLCIAVSSVMLTAGNISDSYASCSKKIKKSIESKSAYEKLIKLCENQGGDIEVIKNPNKFRKSKYRLSIKSKDSGYISKIDAEAFGKALIVLGGGRLKKTDEIDYSVGMLLKKKIGDFVNIGDVLYDIHAQSESAARDAEGLLSNAYEFSAVKPSYKLIYSIVDENGVHEWKQ